jgi:fluoride exporter
MSQLFAVALGGSFGAAFRFLVSSGIYQWLGRGFPYGTLVVNIIGSFLLGLLTEALIEQRITFAHDYRHAILIGFIGAFTTFSTFSLETLYLLEQGSIGKALTNVAISVIVCILAVWLGLLFSRSLFSWSGGTCNWNGQTIPYALMVINTIGAFITAFLMTVVAHKTTYSETAGVTMIIIVTGTYLVLSGLYILLYLIEQGYSFPSQMKSMLIIFMSNTLACLFVMWLGYLSGKDL